MKPTVTVLQVCQFTLLTYKEEIMEPFYPCWADASLIKQSATLSSYPGPGNVELQFKPESLLDVGRKGGLTHHCRRTPPRLVTHLAPKPPLPG